ncbi:MAG: EI24 domain-containing protein, partial [Akkermansiaceae bacterium]
MPLPPTPETVKRELSDLRLAFGVLREPFAWWVMLVGLVGTLLVFTGVACLAWWLIGGLDWLQQGWFAKTRWDEWMLGGVGSILVLVIGWFTFPIILTAMTGAFLEPLADRIERRYYPSAPIPRKVPIGEQIQSSVRVLIRGIGWNLLALPFYFIPVLNVVVYIMLNSFLLSREYFQVVAVRHVSLAEAKVLYRAHRKEMLRGGLTLSILFVIPGINLCAP